MQSKAHWARGKDAEVLAMRAMQYARLMAGVLLACVVAQVSAADTMRIAFIDPLSGTFANVGEMEVRSYQYAIDVVNARGGLLGGGIKLELATFDSRGNPHVLRCIPSGCDSTFADCRGRRR
jgi:ABC-type branched-subunit amino acid transport system substrate-binding protein